MIKSKLKAMKDQTCKFLDGIQTHDLLGMSPKY